MEKQVRVEIGGNGLPTRVFRKDKKWLQCDNWIWLTKKEAVGLIRLQVFERTGGRVAEGETTVLGKCEECERPIRWETFEMHEKIFKGRGGEVSMENCVALCHACHQSGPNAAHADRKWQTAKLK